MNRFHLLSLDEEPIVSEPLIAKETLASEGTTGAPATKAGSKAVRTNFDRRPRGPRKGEGEKHQTVGKGSWGKLGEEEAVAAVPTENEAVSEQEDGAVTTPKLVYKTVQQYLAEREENHRRLAVLSTGKNVRLANEGVELSETVVVKKETPVFTVGAAPITAKKQTAPKESNTVKFTLQELNQILPPAPRREQRPAEKNRDDSRRERRPAAEGEKERRPRGDRSNLGADRPPRTERTRHTERDTGRKPSTAKAVAVKSP